mmetsp:Transcript_773/g.1541  ORF Transcript_773/g.1541 Transcript_773/m.1541 type:complete len:574 (-) Transcript_773:27-1748(-)
MVFNMRIQVIAVVFQIVVQVLIGTQQLECSILSTADTNGEIGGSILLARSVTLKLSSAHSASANAASKDLIVGADTEAKANTSTGQKSSRTSWKMNDMTSNDVATTSASKADANQSMAAARDLQEVKRKPRAAAKKKRIKKKGPLTDEDEDHDTAIDKDHPPWKQRPDYHLEKPHVFWIKHHPEVISIAFWFTMYSTAMAFFCCTSSSRRRRERREASALQTQEDKFWTYVFDEDIFGMAIGLWIKDAHTLGLSEDPYRHTLFWSRIGAHTGLLYFTMTFQVFLLLQISRYVTPTAVDAIRFVYSEYEWRMHGSNMSHGYLLAPNLFVGKPEFFNDDHFEDLHKDLKKDVCHVPFSQPLFFVSIIFLWTLTCTSELRKISEIFEQFVIWLPVLQSSPAGTEEEDTTSTGTAKIYQEEGSSQQIQALSWRLKALISLFILLPRFCVAAALLWIGSRWLAATSDFGDLIMNTLALEFILLLKDLVYFAVVPTRTKRDLAAIEVRLPGEGPSYRAFFGTFLWGIAAVFWAMIYTFWIQQVLPGYKWDVGAPCKDFLRYGEEPPTEIFSENASLFAS